MSNNINWAPKSEWQHDAALKLFDHVESQVRLADQKAGLLVAANSVLLAGYIALFNSGALVRLQTGSKEVVFINIGIACISVLAVIVGILLALYSIDPVSNLKPYDQPQIFFKQIADTEHNKNATDFESNFTKLSHAEFTGQVLRSIHGKSDWASKKLRQINRAVLCSIISVSAAAIAAILTAAPYVIRFLN